MKHLILFLICIPLGVWAGEREALIKRIVEEEIIPEFAALARVSGKMAGWAEISCNHPDFLYNYYGAFAVWSRVSHLRFGPSEEDNRAFALAFWPDPRGKTPKALRKLLSEADPEILTPENFSEVSVAARGFYALDRLLFDENLKSAGSRDARCALLQAIARDIATTTQVLHDEWVAYAPVLLEPGPDKTYRTEEEVIGVLYNAVVAGLQVSADMRLGRPLGTFDKPRPSRAEAWRSGLSLRLLEESVRGSGRLAINLALEDEALAVRLADALANFEARAVDLHEPTFAGVSTPHGRIRVEALLGDLNHLRQVVREELGPYLSVSAGFNALDGD